MTYEDLKEFLINQMRMSHIYQPVMIRQLLVHNGRSSIRNIASDILSRDESQIEYYETIVKNMVLRVLTKRSVVRRDKENFVLNGVEQLDEGLRSEQS